MARVMASVAEVASRTTKEGRRQEERKLKDEEMRKNLMIIIAFTSFVENFSCP